MVSKLISAFILSLLLLLLTISPVYAELSDEEVEVLKEYINRNAKFTKFGNKPLELLGKHGKSAFFTKYSNALLTIRIADDLMSAKDMEAAKKAVEKLEDALVKKLVPGLHNVFGWVGWAKTGMELFKELVVDPALEQTSLEIYANNRLALGPEDAYANARVSGLMRTRNLDRLRKTYGDAIFEKNDKGRLVPQWEKKFEQFAGAWYENQYHLKVLEDVRAEMLKQKQFSERDMAEFDQQMIAMLEQESSEDEDQDSRQGEDETSSAHPTITAGIELAPASSPDTDVGDSVRVGYHYRLDGMTEKKPLVVTVRLVLWDKGQRTLFQSETIDSGAGVDQTGEFEIRITPEFKPGAYRVSLHVEVPELKLHEVSKDEVHFFVDSLYYEAQDELNAVRGDINDCNLDTAKEHLNAAIWQTVSKISQTNFVFKELNDEVLAEWARVDKLFADLPKLYEIYDLVIKSISTCEFTAADEKIQASYAIEKAYPPACGLRSRIDGMNASYAQQRDTLTAMENLNSAESGKEKECNYEGAIDDLNNLVNIGKDMICDRAKQLTDKANQDLASIRRKLDLRNRVEDGIAKAEQMIASKQTKDAEDLLKQLRGMITALNADKCFAKLSADIQNLFAMTRKGAMAVSISGISQAVQGQKVVLTGTIMINGVSVKDPDSYGYKWETSEGKSVTGKKSVTYTPKSPGQKTIRLTVTDDAGNSAASGITINVVKEDSQEEELQAELERAEQAPRSCDSLMKGGVFQQEAGGVEHCVCPGEKVANRAGTACIDKPDAQIAARKCPANAEAFWDAEREQSRCRCKPGHTYSKEQNACLAASNPELDKLFRDVAANRQTNIAADQSERAAASEWRDKSQYADQGPPSREREQQTPDMMGELMQAVGAAVAQSQGVPLPSSISPPPSWPPGTEQTTEIAGRQPESRQGIGQQESGNQTSSTTRAEWQRRLDCLREGRRLYPNTWLDCNGSYTMSDRDNEIRHFEELLNNSSGGVASGTENTDTNAQGGGDWFIITISALPTSDEKYRRFPECRYTVGRGMMFVDSVAGGRREIEASADAWRAKGHGSVEVIYADGSNGERLAQQWQNKEQEGRLDCWTAVTRSQGGGK